LGDRLRDVYAADLDAPLPEHLADLVNRFADAAPEPAPQPPPIPHDDRSAVDTVLDASVPVAT
jgi:hypothetical protein